MAVIPQNVKDIAPELSSQTDDRLNLFIGFAENSVNRTYFKDNADLAVALMAAHLLTVSNSGGAGHAGNVTGVSTGQMNKQFGAVSSSDSESSLLDATAYGRWFKQLRSQYVRTPILV